MENQKSYNIKIYSLLGVFQKTLPDTAIMSDVRFTSQINGWQWELTVSLALPIDTTLVSYNNIVKVYESDENNNGVLIYSGVVTNIKRNSTDRWDIVDIRALGLASMMTWIFYYSGAYTFSKSYEASIIMKDMVDYFATQYPGIISYDANSIENTGLVSYITFEYAKCFESANKIQSTTPFWWHVDSSGKFHFHPSTWAIGQLEHIFTVGYDIENISIEETTEDIVNRYILTYAGWSTYTANDATSQTAYWIHESRETNSDINDLTTATNTASAYVAKYKNPKRRITIVVNERYNIETIRPWDLVTVMNFSYSISSLQIQKIEYNSNKIIIELEQIQSVAQEIKS